MYSFQADDLKYTSKIYILNSICWENLIQMFYKKPAKASKNGV